MAHLTPDQDKQKWEEKKAFIDYLDEHGGEAIEGEKPEARSLGDKIRHTLKSWVWHALGFLIAPAGWAIMFGLEKFAHIAEADYIPAMKPILEQARENPDTPPEVKQILDKVCGVHSFAWSAFLIGVGIAMIITTLISAISPFLNKLTQGVAGTAKSALLPEILAVAAYFRDHTFEARMREILGKTGYPEDDINATINAYRAIPKEGDARDLFLRGFEDEAKAKANLERMGYSAEDTDRMLKLFWAVPPLSDMVRFADFSAFDPDVIARWKEFFDLPSWLVEPFGKVGIKDEEPDKWGSRYWFSHWRQPGRYELGDLHRRNLIGDDDALMAYKTMGYSRFWQENLLNLVREIPTRVDVRRWWDMRTIDEARLKEIYHAQGYYDKDLDDYVLWTKVYVAWPDLIARFKNGWITLDEVKSELTSLGMPDERVQEMIETKVKPAQPERTAKERDLTKSEIIKGVKKEVITWEQGAELLVAMGYDENEAQFMLSINIAAETGSPESYMEFLFLVNWYKTMLGKPSKIPPNDLILAEKGYKEAKAIHDTLVQEKAPEKEIAEAAVALVDAEYRYSQLLALWREEVA